MKAKDKAPMVEPEAPVTTPSEGDTAPAVPEVKAAIAAPVVGDPPRVTADVPPGKLRRKVWPHGSIEHDGVTYAAGTEVEFPAAVVAALGDALVEG